MLPLYPPYPVADLAREHLEGRQPNGRPRPHPDPDGFLPDASALQPDPVFMGFRRLVTSGPLDRLVRAIGRRIEAREDRIHAPRAEDVAPPVVLTETSKRHSGIGENEPRREPAA